MKYTIEPYYLRLGDQNKYHDFFDRDAFASNLTNLIWSSDSSLTIAINSGWGEGKTTFIRKWGKDLETDDHFIPIFYDAFENDFASDAFISIAVTIQESIFNYYKGIGINKNQEKIVAEYKSLALKLGTELTKMSTDAIINVASGGVFNANKLFELLFMTAEKIDKRENKALIDEKYDAFLDRRETIREYHKALNSLITESGAKDKKIIFFIDELDRCRPDFAVQVIEKIKHLFSIKNVSFILSINSGQLVEIIKHSYGVNDRDALIYLQKFVHIETNLPTLKDLKNSRQNLKKYLDELFEAFEIPDHFLDSDKFFNVINKSLSVVDYTPRSIERTLTLYTISLSSCDLEKSKALYKQIFLVSLLKIHLPPIYLGAKTRGIINKHYDLKGTQFYLGESLFKYLSSGVYFDSPLISNSDVSIEVGELQEAIKIVDMYNLPQEPDSVSKS